MMRFVFCILALALIVPTASGEQKPNESSSPSAPAVASNTNTQIFQAKGVIVELKPDQKVVRIRHEEIPGYMDAMTMPFDVRSTNELSGLRVGDAVTFRMIVTEKDGWIEQIKKDASGDATVNTLPANAPIRIVRDVEPLSIGDVLPDYRFTNHLEQAVNLSQFRGQAIAITFIFTRCPFPTFCPLMSQNFREVRDSLVKNSPATTNWMLLTISFDPDFDTPEKLRNYAAMYKADPRHWNFLTGTLEDITAFSEQVGLQFWRDPQAGINHNLRTVVVDARGRVQKIIAENKWTPEELTAEIIKAAKIVE